MRIKQAPVVQPPAPVEEKKEVPVFTSEYLEHMNTVLAQQPLEAVIQWCYNSLPNFHQVTSFGSTGMVIIHAIHKLGLKVPVIFLDTLYHFEETLAHAKEVEEKYGLQVSWYRCAKASTRAEFEKYYRSDDMWISAPQKYEWLTKVEPLDRALEELKVGAWITGRRRDQGALRTDLSILELDPADGRIKVNLLAFWSKDEIWAYLRREGVPYNPLFDKSYASIGDSVTTTQTSNGEGERSGRFHQFGGAKTECGIHVRKRPIEAAESFDVDRPISSPVAATASTH